LSEGSQDYDLVGYTKEQIINDILDQYERHMQFLHWCVDPSLASPVPRGFLKFNFICPRAVLTRNCHMRPA
jgi:hypothetical protein